MRTAALPFVVLVALALHAGSALAAPPAPTATATPTQTPTATATASNTATALPSPTSSPTPSPSPIPSGGHPAGQPNNTCLFSIGPWDVCPNLGDMFGAIGHALTGLASGLVSHMWDSTAGALIGTVVATPNLTDNGSYAPLNSFQTTLSDDAMALFTMLFTLGVFWTVVPAMWRYDAQASLTIIFYGAAAAALVHGLPEIMNLCFGLDNAFAQSVMANHSDQQAFIQAIFNPNLLSGNTGALAVLGLVLAAIAVVLIFFISVQRFIGIYALSVLYAILPLLIVLMVVPFTRPIAKRGALLFANLMLWGPFYSIMIKVTVIFIAGFGANGVVGFVAGLAGLFALAGAPKILDVLLGIGLAHGRGPLGALMGIASAAASGGAAAARVGKMVGGGTP